MFVWPHGIHVDRDGNVWVTDARAASPDDLKKFPGEGNKGSVVVKFSPDGKVLMTLGKPGVRGNPPDALTDPTDVVTDPRMVTSTWRRAIRTWPIPIWSGASRCSTGTGSSSGSIGKSRNRAWRVPDAARARVRFPGPADRRRPPQPSHPDPDEGGKFIREYDDFGRTSGLAIDRNDVIYTADSESTERVHPGWQRGIRIGSLKDGKVTIFVPPHMTPNAPEGAMGEGIAIDAAGNVYTAEAQLRGVTKYVKK